MRGNKMFNAEKVKNECVEWIRDFFDKNGRDCNAVVGISGGKDSSVVAGLCVEALGKDRVIGVLMPQGEQHDIDASYQNFSLSDLQSREKMQSTALGDIHIYGGTYPITYNNEAVQIGYRLGKLSAHNRVYAIDDDTALDMSAMNHPTPSLTAALHTLRDVDQPGNSLLERYRIYNSEAWSKANHAVYVQANAIRTQENAYAGAEMVAKWYERNLKIFANIQHLAANHERLLILFGAGHLEILKSLVNADCNLELVDSSEYLSL
jgi:hypothetical protein